MASDGTIKITTELDNAKAEAAMSKFSSFANKAMTATKVAAGAATAALSAMAFIQLKLELILKRECQRYLLSQEQQEMN